MSGKESSKNQRSLFIWMLYFFLGFLILILLYNDLRGSSILHVNSLKLAHFTATICSVACVALLFNGLEHFIKSLLKKSSEKQMHTWFIMSAVFCLLWFYVVGSELSFSEILGSNKDFWWLDPNSYYFSESLAMLCEKMDDPPTECTLEWFKSSYIRNYWLIEEYSKAVLRLVTFVPMLLILLFPSLIEYYKSKHS